MNPDLKLNVSTNIRVHQALVESSVLQVEQLVFMVESEHQLETNKPIVVRHEKAFFDVPIKRD